MKRLFLFVLIVLLALLPVTLFAQTEREPAYTILLTPITAASTLEEDSDPIYQSLISELSWQGQLNSLFRLVETRGRLESPPSMTNFPTADQELNPRYVVTAALSIDGPDRVLALNLYNTENFELIGNQELGYQVLDEALGMMAFFCWSLSSTLPPDDRPTEPEVIYVNPEDDITWKNKWLYLGLQGGVSFRLYTSEPSSDIGITTAATTFNAAIRLEFQFAHFIAKNNYFSFSLESGVDISQENLNWRDYKPTGDKIEPLDISDASNSGLSLAFPGLLKFNFKPGNFSSSLFGGVYYILPLDNSVYTSPLGIISGLSAGVRLGPGVFHVDFHYSLDLGSKEFDYDATKNDTNPLDVHIDYKRQMFTLVVGYKFGFINRPDKRKAQSAQAE
jgi:hypothetical protein